MFEDIMEKEEFNRSDLIVLYIIKTLNEMVDCEIMIGKQWELTDKADELLKDFKPTDEELKAMVLLMKSEGYIE